MFLKMIYDDRLAQAAYLLGCQKTGEAIIIDPERDIDRYIEIASREKLRITAATETHIHADFLSGTREFAERGVQVYLSDEGGPDWSYGWVKSPQRATEYKIRLLKHGDTISIGEIELEVVHSPGHTPEHIAFLVVDKGSGAKVPIAMATGDLVFVGDVGRPDLLESAAGQVGQKEPSARKLCQSLRQFAGLPEFLQVWPGHGAGSACGKALGAIPQSTIGYELRTNTAIEMAVRDENKFVEAILHGQPEPPLYFSRMKTLNRDGAPVIGSVSEPRELRANDIGAALRDRRVIVVDTRPWPEFRQGHLPGALHIPDGKSFPTVAGSYIGPENLFLLVSAASRALPLATELVRVGVDHSAGFITPQTMAEYLNSGHPSEQSKEISPEEFLREQKGRALVLDVRGSGEYGEGHVPDSLNIPYTRLSASLEKLPHDRTILVHCLGGGRSAVATALLARSGFDAVNVAGGWNALRSHFQ